MNRTIRSAPDYGLLGEPAKAAFPDLVHIERLQERSGPRRWRIAAHRHPALHQIFWIERGGGTIRLNDATHELDDATMAIVPAGTVHGFHFITGTEGVVVTLPDIVFDPIRRAVDRTRRLTRPAVLTGLVDAPPALGALAREHGAHDAHRAEALNAQVTLLLIWILRHGPRSPESVPHQDTAGGPLFNRFLAILDGEYSRLHTVDSYARALAVTAPHLSRVCRQARGRSASALIRDRQMLEARRLLAYTQIRVAGIAYDLGFSDPDYFSRVFTANTGIAPRTFRQGFTNTATDANGPAAKPPTLT
ncbi:helix-turn-helix domain-containing protein [Stappia sp. ES.058]|uniref:helix-turn-helix domain-containing protein n=1 Tax=Stappia sp. ES.058 TaxID=1881061 RepID=UPI00087C82AE|nr:helix-turn-helix domain-containing protein [Stappia sp. ES.058]SDU44091.1 transcriptional regulator, AraC family [Stappia sp. ES.058]